MSEQEEYQELPVHENVPPDEEPAGRGLFESLLVRVTLGLVVLVVVIGVVGAIVFYSMRSSRNKPLNVKVFPGATLIEEQQLDDGFDHHDRRLYSSMATLEEVEAFYDKQKGVSCKPYTGSIVDGSGAIIQAEGHNFSRCEIDHSGWGVDQYTTILIQAMYDDAGNPTSQVAIEIQRYWGD